jgi:hypothetical protein
MTDLTSYVEVGGVKFLSFSIIYFTTRTLKLRGTAGGNGCRYDTQQAIIAAFNSIFQLCGDIYEWLVHVQQAFCLHKKANEAA